MQNLAGAYVHSSMRASERLGAPLSPDDYVRLCRSANSATSMLVKHLPDGRQVRLAFVGRRVIPVVMDGRVVITVLPRDRWIGPVRVKSGGN